MRSKFLRFERYFGAMFASLKSSIQLDINNLNKRTDDFWVKKNASIYFQVLDRVLFRPDGSIWPVIRERIPYIYYCK